MNTAKRINGVWQASGKPQIAAPARAGDWSAIVMDFQRIVPEQNPVRIAKKRPLLGLRFR